MIQVKGTLNSPFSWTFHSLQVFHWDAPPHDISDPQKIDIPTLQTHGINIHTTYLWEMGLLWNIIFLSFSILTYFNMLKCMRELKSHIVFLAFFSANTVFGDLSYSYFSTSIIPAPWWNKGSFILKSCYTNLLHYQWYLFMWLYY